MKIGDYVLLVCKKNFKLIGNWGTHIFLVGSSKTLHKCAKGEDTGQQSDLVFKDEMPSYPKCPVKTLRIITIYCVSSPRAAFASPLLSITMSSNPLKSKLSVNIWVGCFVPRMTNEVHFVASKKTWLPKIWSQYMFWKFWNTLLSILVSLKSLKYFLLLFHAQLSWNLKNACTL